jgi:two-component system NtrC family sensor kinase
VEDAVLKTMISEDNWQYADRINNLLADDLPLEITLRTALGLVLEAIGCVSGAFIIQKLSEKYANSHISQNLSTQWQDYLSNPESNFQTTLQNVLHTRNSTLCEWENLKGIAFPLSAVSGLEGVFLLPDQKQQPIFTEFLQILLHQVGRLVHIKRTSSINEFKKNIYALSTIASAQNAHFDTEQMQLIILNGIRHITKCGAISLVLLDPQNNLIIKKILDEQNNLFYQESIHLEDSLLYKCINLSEAHFINDIQNHPCFNPKIDGLSQIKVVSLICIPMEANQEKLGAIQIFNHQNTQMDSFEENMLKSMVTSLANSMVSMKLIQQLKVTNADLEANRWELLNSRNTLRALFDNLPMSIYIINPDYSIAAINMAWVDRINMRPADVVGKKCCEILFNQNNPCPGCNVQDTFISGEKITRHRQDWDEENDQPIEWEITTYPIKDNSGKTTQVIAIEQDITEKRRLEADLIQSEKLAAIGQLSAGIAHEINNPLSAIIANAQLIQRGIQAEDEDLKESAKLIELAGIRASQSIQNLLQFSRKERYEFTSTYVNDTIENALALLNHELTTKSINLALKLNENISQVIASKDHLQGVWINLIINAMDAMNGIEGQKNLSIATKEVNREIHIQISDNGQGIPKEKIAKIFEPFYTTKSAGQGTGLGLSVCHRIIKQHGGDIQVESLPGKGTKMTVILPVQK